MAEQRHLDGGAHPDGPAAEDDDRGGHVPSAAQRRVPLVPLPERLEQGALRRVEAVAFGAELAEDIDGAIERAVERHRGGAGFGLVVVLQLLGQHLARSREIGKIGGGWGRSMEIKELSSCSHLCSTSRRVGRKREKLSEANSDAIIRSHQKPSEATGRHQKPLEAIGSHRKPSEAPCAA